MNTGCGEAYTVKMETSFEAIDLHELQVGVKYKIKHSPMSYDYYTGIFKKHDDILQVFQHVVYHSSIVTYKVYELECVRGFYYKMVSQKEKIQQAMEKRALHILLRRIVDESFVWE